MQPRHTISLALEKIFSQIQQNSTQVKSNEIITDDQLVAMFRLVGQDAERAYADFKTAQVFLFSDEFDRKIFMIETSPSKCYFVYQFFNSCSCHSFRHRVLIQVPGTFVCKHIIIARLAEATGKLILQKIPQKKLSTIFASSLDYDITTKKTIIKISNQNVPIKEYIYDDNTIDDKNTESTKNEDENINQKENSQNVPSQRTLSQITCVSYTQASQLFHDLMLSQPTGQSRSQLSKK